MNEINNVKSNNEDFMINEVKKVIESKKDNTFISDPFINLFELPSKKLFVNREIEIKIISKILSDLDKIKNSVFYNIVGNLGSGKMTTMKQILDVLKKKKPKTRIREWTKQECRLLNQGTYVGKPYFNNIKYDIQIFYGLNNVWKLREKIKEINENYFLNSKINIFIWDTRIYWTNLRDYLDYLKKKKINFGLIGFRVRDFLKEKIIFNNYKKDIIREIIEKRLDYIKEISQGTHPFFELDFYNLFIENYLSIIIEISNGNLRIVFKILDFFYNNPYILNLEQFDIILEKFSQLKEAKLTNNQEMIMDYFFSRPLKKISIKEFTKKFNINRTTTWKNLEKLVSKKMLKKIINGKKVLYFANPNFLPFYENHRLKDIKQGNFIYDNKKFNIMDFY